VEKICGLN